MFMKLISLRPTRLGVKYSIFIKSKIFLFHARSFALFSSLLMTLSPLPFCHQGRLFLHDRLFTSSQEALPNDRITVLNGFNVAQISFTSVDFHLMRCKSPFSFFIPTFPLYLKPFLVPPWFATHSHWPVLLWPYLSVPVYHYHCQASSGPRSRNRFGGEMN